MAKVECWFKQDLKKPVRVQTYNGSVFTLDNVGSLIGVEVYSNGEAVTLTGSVTGYVILPDETTVSVAGTRSGNKASINLPQSALAYSGMIRIAIKLTNDSEITTLLAIIATVAKSRTGTVITPSQQIITDWSQQIAAEMQAVEDASAAQDAKIDNLEDKIDGNLQSINIIKGIIAGQFSGSNLTIASAVGGSIVYFPVVSGKKYTIVKPETTVYWRVGYSTTKPVVGTTLTNYDSSGSTSSTHSTYTAPITGYLAAYIANNNVSDKPAFDAGVYAYEGEYNSSYNIYTAKLVNTNVPENIGEILNGFDADIQTLETKTAIIEERIKLAFTNNDTLNANIQDCKFEIFNSNIKKMSIEFPQNATTYFYVKTFNASDEQIERKTVIFAVYYDSTYELLLYATSDFRIRMIISIDFVSGNHPEYVGIIQNVAYGESELFDVQGYPYDKHITNFYTKSSGDPLTAYLKLREGIKELYINTEAITVTGIDIVNGTSIRLLNGNTSIITKTLDSGYKGPVLIEDYCAMYVDFTNLGTVTLLNIPVARTGIEDNPIMTSTHIFYCGANRELSTLKAGIEEAVKYMGSILYVDPGEYNLITEFGSTYFANLPDTDQQAGLKLGNRIHVIFSSNSIVTCNYTGNNPNVCTCFSPFNQDNRYGFTLENLTLFSARTRYGVHDVGGVRHCVTKYINCHIEEDNSNNPYWGTQCAIAAGLGTNHELEISNCVFYGRVYWHVSSGESADFKENVRCMNNYFINDTIQISVSRNDASLDTEFVLGGNSIVRMSDSDTDGIVRTTTGGGHFNIYAWNNEVRESA